MPSPEISLLASLNSPAREAAKISCGMTLSSWAMQDPPSTSSRISESQNPLPVAHTIFHRFPDLPPELRQKIWVFTLPGPRLIPFVYEPATSLQCSNHYKSPGKRMRGGCTSTAPIPITLHINRESRIVASTIGGYRLDFGLFYFGGKVWFCPQKDTLFFPASNITEGEEGNWCCSNKEKKGHGRGDLATYKNFSNSTNLIEPSALSGVRRLAVDAGIFGFPPRDERGGNNWTLSTCRDEVEDPLMLGFWEILRGKFSDSEEVVFFVKTNIKHAVESRGTFSGVFLPGEWLKEIDMTSRVRGLGQRIERAVELVGGGRNKRKREWVAPRWSIVVSTEEVEET